MAIDYSRLVPIVQQLGDQVTESLQILDGMRLAKEAYPQLNPDQPVLLVGLAGRQYVQDVVHALLKVYAGDHKVTVMTPDRREMVTIAGLATDTDWGEDVTLFIPPLPRPGSYLALQNVVARLRAPDGCPWDRELTWAKLRAFLLEETHELLAALDAEDARKVAEEQGDVLLQIALQQQIAVEEDKFHSGDVIAGIVEKLIRRHPHVFGDAVVSNTEEVLANWEVIKRAERASNGEKRSPLTGVPKGLPALAQTEAYLDRIARIESVETPEEPWTELAGATGQGEPVTDEMVGRALFGLVAWARAHDIDAESALRTANTAYAERYSD